MTEDHERLLIGYVRRAIDGAARCGVSPLDLAYTMLIQSAAMIRQAQGQETFVAVMERTTSSIDDGMDEAERTGRPH